MEKTQTSCGSVLQTVRPALGITPYVEGRGIEPLYVLPPFCFQDSGISNSANLLFAENKRLELLPLLHGAV